MAKRFQTHRIEGPERTQDDAERRRQQIIEGLRDAFMSLDAQWRITECNSRVEAILGETRTELLGRAIWDVVGVPPDSPLGELARSIKETGEAVEGEFTLALRGAERLLNVRGFPLGEGVGVMAADITEMRAAERRLAASEARFRELANGVPAPTWTSTPDGAVDYINPAMLETLGVAEGDLEGRNWERRVHADDLSRLHLSARESRPRPARVSLVVKVQRGDGAWRTLQVTGVPRFDAHGAFSGHIGIATDITDLLAARKRQAMLVNELNHRVRNTLATVQSIIRQTLKDNPAQKSTLDLLNHRVMALAAAHSILSQERWEGAELNEMARQAVRHCDPEGHRIAISGPSVRLEPGAALALFLALNELATNALRHGALSASEGRVTLHWARGDQGVDLEWRETGGPEVVPPARKGFGSRLLGAGLAAELGAPAQIHYATEGVICRMRAPKEALLA